MSKITRAIAPLSRAVRAFFQADVHLRRGHDGLRLVLDEPARPEPVAAAPSERRRAERKPLSERQRRELARMLSDLSQLLDQTPGNRAALRPLSMVEQGLRKSGLRVFEKMPLDLMRQALAQLEGLVTNWSQEGLACLRSKLAVAVIEREVPEGPGAPVTHAEDVIDDAPLSHPIPLDEADVAEAERALFAAYGALGVGGAPAGAPGANGPEALKVEMQGELDSPSARAMVRESKCAPAARVDLRLRELHD